ncbi:actin-related, putative [Babesia caballi]|uniref:Actin-related, putative n=1 Tax=Babesia caballi TaxID=5871 RepID=A0AAV4M227_BABCB|nr:actin-related, putative [Babesia caballi]
MDASAYATLPRVVLDNGSGNLKFSLASSKKPPTVLPNCVGQPKRKFTSQSFASEGSHGGSGVPAVHADHGDAVSDGCYTLWEYFCLRPYSSGLLYEPNRQRVIWNKVMGSAHSLVNGVPANLLGVAPATSAICVTEPNMCPDTCRQSMAELIFEDLGFSLAAIVTSQAASCWYYSAAKNPGSAPGSGSRASASAELGLIAYPKPQQPRRPQKKGSQCCLVVDCGFEASHCVPFANGRPIQRAALRSALAGSQLNAYLKNVSALRTVNLEFNELLVQHMKEEACYVSSDFDLELRAAGRLRYMRGHTALTHNYVLPTYSSKSKGHLMRHFNNYSAATPPLLTKKSRTLVERIAAGAELTPAEREAIGLPPVEGQPVEDSTGTNGAIGTNGEAAAAPAEEAAKEDKKASSQTVGLFTERFAIPEILFSPQDLHLQECGIAEVAFRSIGLAPQCLQRQLASNVLLTGGSTKFPGFKERFYSELRRLLPSEWDLQIHSAEDPALTAFYGARLFARDDSAFLESAVTRNYYLEHGGIFPRR